MKSSKDCSMFWLSSATVRTIRLSARLLVMPGTKLVESGLFYVKVLVSSELVFLRGGGVGIAFREKGNLFKKLILPKVCLAIAQCNSKRKSFSGYDRSSY
jgi:hypothetical protein